MAKTPETETPRKKVKASNIVVWIILVLVMIGLGGFGVTNFGGGLTAIGRVGDREVTTQDYARALQQQINALSAQIGQPVPFQQAQAFGLDRQVLQSVVTRAALDNEAARIGISVGDATVADEILQMAAFQGTAGAFDRDTYRFTLERNDMTEAQFEQGIREDVARSILQGAVVGGFAAPEALTERLFAWAAERRSFSALPLTPADLPAPVTAPTEAELEAFHAENIDRFTRPEAKRITYVALLPEMLAPEMEVDEAALRALYEARIDEFVIPERRLVERLVFPTEADAQAARARLDAGNATFDDLVAERGLTLDDVDLGDVSRSDLGDAADAVFALQDPGVAGPAPSSLGPALFRMNAILDGQETDFEAAREDLSAELRVDAARRAISGRVDAIDDLLASGATLEEVAAEQGLELATIDYIASETPEGITAYPEFRTAAEALQEGDFPQVILLDEGALAAMRLDAVVPPTPIPLNEVRDEVATAWTDAATQEALLARAEDIRAAVEGGQSLGGFGIVSVTRGITRDGFVADAPPGLLDALFDMMPGEVRVVQGAGQTAVLRLDAVLPAETEGEEAIALREALSIRAQQTLAQDAFTLFTDALSREAGIQIDQNAVNAVHAQFN